MTKRTGEKVVFKGRRFIFKELNIQSDNDKNVRKKYKYEIIETKNAVVIVPIDKDNNVYFINEYCAAFDQYMLVLPKGGIDNEEDPKTAANRELQEEIGMKALKLEFLAEFTIAPGYIKSLTSSYLATNLVKSKLEGDEIEVPQIFKYPLNKFEDLIKTNKLSEARIISALYLARNLVKILY